MRPVVLFGLALVLAAVQSSLLRWVAGGEYSLALPLVIVVFLGLRAGNVEGAVASAGVGYVMDLCAGVPKGLLTSLAVALFLFSRLAGAAVDVQGRVAFAVLTGVGTFLFGAMALGLLDLVQAPEMAPTWVLLGRVGAEALLTALASPFLLVVLRRVDGHFHREEHGLLGSVNR